MVEQATGDKAVSLFLDAESLVAFDFAVRPLQSIRIEMRATKVAEHLISGYGPHSVGVRGSVDNSVTARTLIPSPGDEFEWNSIGQYVNAYAFSEK